MRYIMFLAILIYSSSAYAFEKYELPCNADLLEKSLYFAINEAGTAEKANGGKVMKYLSAVSIKYPAPYCAAGQYWAFLNAANELGLPQSAIPIKNTASVRLMFNHAKLHGTKKAFHLEKHDLLVWRLPGSSRGHIERAIEHSRKGIINCIGFNTSKVIAGKSVEGVFIKRRTILHPLGRLLFKGAIGFKEAA